MKQFELMDILKYRRQLMGISAIFILICHTIAYVDMPSIFKYIFAFVESVVQSSVESIVALIFVV